MLRYGLWNNQTYYNGCVRYSGSGVTYDSYGTAMCRLSLSGAVVVVAAGNDAMDAALFTPANYGKVTGAITVSAIADYDGRPGGADYMTQACGHGGLQFDDELAVFSNFNDYRHPEPVVLAAPGVCIMSTINGQQYTTASGTSMVRVF